MTEIVDTEIAFAPRAMVRAPWVDESFFRLVQRRAQAPKLGNLGSSSVGATLSLTSNGSTHQR
jgi:hypothetical protein